MAILKGTNIHKHYNNLHVLKGIDISVEAGEVIAITGKSGAGKSTLLHILGTLDAADEGEVEIAGMVIKPGNNRQLAKVRNSTLGFVFQFHHLLNEFTALENVCMPALIAGMSAEKAQKRAKELLDYLGLAERLNHKPTELSGGEQQRAAVARALVNDPGIVLADEPTGNLDIENSSELHRLFLKLREDFGQTFVIVTHNRDLANMCDRRLEMRDGIFTAMQAG